MIERRSTYLASQIGGIVALLAGGCQIAPDRSATLLDLEPMPVIANPAATRVDIPMRVIAGLVVLETQGKDGPWRFLIDTGASRTLVSPEYAIRHMHRLHDPDPQKVWLRDASGRAVPVESVMLNRIDFGPANFQNVRALVFDCSEISDHLGLQIDGVLGFSLFSNTRLTLDYPGEQVTLSAFDDDAPLRGCVLPYTAHNDVPFVQLNLGSRSLVTLIDTGSDGGLNLDPAGLDLDFVQPPREGTLVGTLHGDHRQILARLGPSLHIGDHEVVQPIVDLSGSTTSIGGDLLRRFAITFDPESRQVAFYRPDSDEQMRLTTPPKRSVGVSFNKARAYWKINAVAPESPAAAAGLAVGDLVSRVNGEPVETWDLARYRVLIDAGNDIAFTLIKGRDEVVVTTSVFTLVP